MVEINVRVNPANRLAYLPKLIVEQLGPDFIIFPNHRSAVLFRKGDDMEAVARSAARLAEELGIIAKETKRPVELASKPARKVIAQ
jgi:hypothetical protein